MIAIHFSTPSLILSMFGIAIGYSYTLLPVGYLVTQDYFYIKAWLLFGSTRFVCLATLNFLLQGRIVVDTSFLIGDPLNLITYVISFFDNTVWWGGVRHRMGSKTQILE